MNSYSAIIVFDNVQIIRDPPVILLLLIYITILYNLQTFILKICQ